jgi:transcription elongation factor Elf1
MFFVQCPRCGAVVELAADSVGIDRRHKWNVTQCDECDFAFDYDDAEVHVHAESSTEA